MPSNFCLAANWKLFSIGAQRLKKLQKLPPTPKLPLVFSINSSSHRASNTRTCFFRLEWFTTPKSPKQIKRLPKQHFLLFPTCIAGGFGLLMEDLHQGDMEGQHAWKVQDSNFHSITVWDQFFFNLFLHRKKSYFFEKCLSVPMLGLQKSRC